MAACQGPGPYQPTPTPRPPLVVRAWVEYPVARMGNVQTFYVQVSDPEGRTLKGVNVIGEVNSQYGRVSLTFPVTDSSGQTRFKEAIPTATAGTLFEVRVLAFVNNDTGEVYTSYTVWP